jgi:NAD-dependent deacetylase
MLEGISRTDFGVAVRLMRKASSCVALTGAGISTPSGIPDFRSTGSGLWSQYDPMEVASIMAFRRSPEKFYAWIHPMACQIMKASPNPAHFALAHLEQAGRLRGVVTQNIDGLHLRAGSKKILELHGNLRKAICPSCMREFPTAQMFKRFAETAALPRCTDCGVVLKPAAILYGEELPFQAVMEARKLMTQCDILIVIGSSLEVTPAALLPIEALNNGASLLIFNRDPTYVDERASAVFRQDVAEILPLIANEVLRE